MANTQSGRLIVDFSIVSSFDYTGGSSSRRTPRRFHRLPVAAATTRRLPPSGATSRRPGLPSAWSACSPPSRRRGATPPDVRAQQVLSGDDPYELFARAAPYASRACASNWVVSDMEQRNLRIAVSKGSLFGDAVELLTEAGLDTTGLADPGRRLIISNPGVDFIIVRPTDAPVFVTYGGADCGICGKDTLVEAGLSVMELVDLRFGYCRFIVAEPRSAVAWPRRTTSVWACCASRPKYPNITRAFFEERGVQVDVIKMHGNIELAPLVGMADRIVDITATGTTLRENNLRIVDEVLSSTARFIANSASVRTDVRVRELAARLEELTRDRDVSLS